MGLFGPYDTSLMRSVTFTRLRLRGALGGIFVHPDPEWTGPPGGYVSAKGSFSTIGVDDYETDHRLKFDRWLEEIKAETSFVGGMVAVGQEAKDLRSVLVAVTPEDFVFFDEGGAGDAEMPELGRFPRSAVKAVDVLDESGAHVAEPNVDSIDEPDALAAVTVDWQPEGKELDRDQFVFRAASVAWDAAHRFRTFAQPPLLG